MGAKFNTNTNINKIKLDFREPAKNIPLKRK